LRRAQRSQAGQYIKYGCGKGECGTCEALCNGKWIRPCSTKVPALAAGETFTIVLKEGAAKRTSSGKFFSVRSFIAGARSSARRQGGAALCRRVGHHI
jgi:aerobic-type carbon monoxide dehydrogenase small subunit (CoxS/CutS family)